MGKDAIKSKLLDDFQRLENRIVALEKENLLLKKENKILPERLSRYENPKNSRNSSIPPSKDENRPKKNQSLRNKTEKKPGGQPGRKGRTLEMTATPDNVVDLYPDFCNDCGISLENTQAIFDKSRQIVDIPPINAVWTEYRTYTKNCNCGCNTLSDFPEDVKSPVSYGSNIESLIGYFHARQYLPFSRMKEMMSDVFNINISEGGLHYLLNRFADKTAPFYENIRQRVSQSKVIGTDETGVKVNGNKHWFWTWQTQNLTYIAHSDTRGKAAINTHFPDGFPEATLVRDGWRAQTGTIAAHHQTCLAHLLRDLKYHNEKYSSKWSMNFRILLLDAMELSETKETNQPRNRYKIIQRLEILLLKPPNKKHKELYTFYKRICRERQNLFTFLFIENVPPDNNASERAIRNVKVKQKISGQFKTERTAQNFAMIRSVIDTTIKNGMNVLEALNLIAKFQLNSIY